MWRSRPVRCFSVGKVTVLTMGHTGVVLDPHTLEPGLPLDALAQAQNAIQDPKEGHGGAVRKRPGLARFNIAYAGGVILGGIPMPVAGFGGAPSAGGGAPIGTGDVDDGTSIGTGDMTGAPGGTFDGGNAISYPPGASQFNGGTQIFGGRRLFVVGRLGSDATVSQEGGSGWYVSSKGLVDVGTARTTPGPPITPYSFPAVTPFVDAWGSPYCVKDNAPAGLYYGGAYGNQLLGIAVNRTIGTGPNGLSIRRTDGTSDNLVTTIGVNTLGRKAGIDDPNHSLVTVAPNGGGSGSGYIAGDVLNVVGGVGSAATITVATVNGSGVVLTATVTVGNEGSYSTLPTSPFATTGGSGSGATFTYTSSTTPRAAITFLIDAPDGNIYAGVKDKYSGQDTTGSLGRVFRVTPSTGALVERFLVGGSVGIPTIPFTHVPYSGQWFDSKLFVGTFPDAINEVAPVYTVEDNTEHIGSEGLGGADGYQHAMMAAMAEYNGRLFLGTGVWQTAASFAQVWSRRPGEAIDSNGFAWTQLMATTGGVAQNGNYVVSMVVFNDALYVSWFNPSQSSKIYKVVANNVGDPTSTSFTVTTVATSGAEINNAAFYLFVDEDVMYAIAVTDSGPSTSAYTTPDGAVWTNKSTSLPTLGTTSRMRPIFFGLNQS